MKWWWNDDGCKLQHHAIVDNSRHSKISVKFHTNIGQKCKVCIYLDNQHHTSCTVSLSTSWLSTISPMWWEVSHGTMCVFYHGVCAWDQGMGNWTGYYIGIQDKMHPFNTVSILCAHVVQCPTKSISFFKTIQTSVTLQFKMTTPNWYCSFSYPGNALCESFWIIIQNGNS